MSNPAGVMKQQKRTRNSCNLCRKMKIRCDREGDKCSNCTARGVQCVLTLTESKKPKAKKGEYLNSIEGRIQRMEALLQSSGIVTNSATIEESKTSPSELSEGVEVLTPNEQLSNLVINDSGKHEYIGPSSGFALLSPRGMAWVQARTGSNRMNGILERIKHPRPVWPSFSGGGEYPFSWPDRSFHRHEVPSKETANLLVTHFFNTFNATFPLFDRNVFYSYFERQYSSDPPQNTSWWGAFNIVMAIACIASKDMIRVEQRVDQRVESSIVDFNEFPLKFFQNAATVLLDILFTETDLMGVQTVVGLAVVMQAVSNPEGAFLLTATAARLAHGMGLHRWLAGFGLSSAELEQRKLVFWVILALEKSTCLRIGRPSVLNDDDIGVSLPAEDLHAEGGGIRIPSMGHQKFYPFRTMCLIALIESKVYSELYSARSQAKTADEKLRAVGHLDGELQDWKDLIPLEIRPEHEIQCDPEHIFSVVMLHYTYYNCLTAIHRVSVHHGSWIGKDEELETYPEQGPFPAASSTNIGLNPRVYASYTLCLSAARAIIHLTINFMDSASNPRNSLIWIAQYFPISACLTIFAHVLQSPLDPKSASDLGLMERTHEFMSRSYNSEMNAALVPVLEIIGELISIAREHVKETENKESTSSGLIPPGQADTRNAAGVGPTIQHPTAFIEPHTSWTPFPPFTFMPHNTGDAAFMATPDLSSFDFSTFMNTDGAFLTADDNNQYGWPTN